MTVARVEPVEREPRGGARRVEPSLSLLDMLRLQLSRYDAPSGPHGGSTRYVSLLRPFGLHPFFTVLAIFIAGRLLTAVMMAYYAANQGAVQFSPGRPDLFTYGAIWDGQWYKRIVEGHYPTVLPTDEQGYVTENAWAFMPLFPLIVSRIIMLTHLPYPVVGTLVSLVAGALASWFCWQLCTRFMRPTTAFFGVALLQLLPFANMFQVSYAESLGFMLMLLTVKLIAERNLAFAMVAAPLAAIARPQGLALTLAIGLYFAARIIDSRRGGRPLVRREMVQLVVLGCITLAFSFAQVLGAWLVTGDLHAYTNTEVAWRAGIVGRGELVPFEAWIKGHIFYVGFGTGTSGSAGAATFGMLFSVLEVVLAVVLCRLAWVRRMPFILQAFQWSYLLYLFGVFFPQSSTFRLLMPVAMIWVAFANIRKTWARIIMLGLMLWLQFVWLGGMWYANYFDWSPP